MWSNVLHITLFVLYCRAIMIIKSRDASRSKNKYFSDRLHGLDITLGPVGKKMVILSKGATRLMLCICRIIPHVGK